MIKYLKLLLFLTLIFGFISFENLFAGGLIQPTIPETDSGDPQLVGFFDLRNRESFIQITNIDSGQRTVHIQIFNVDQDCNENNFFDVYTPNDTHTYDIRNILTNDGNPAGFVLPDNAYGIVVVTYVNDFILTMIGNLRILDQNGYEYRTNLNGIGQREITGFDEPITFNFNNSADILFSDIVGVALDETANVNTAEVQISNIIDAWALFDVDIYDNIENPFSCRNVIFSCVDQDNPRLEEFLEFVANNTDSSASVASFEYGINNAIPHSKGGELLCPGNTTPEGFARMNFIGDGGNENDFILFIGLNNGNSRGSIDSAWYPRFD